MLDNLYYKKGKSQSLTIYPSIFVAVESVTHMITIEYNDDDDGRDDERKLHVFVFECDITITMKIQVVGLSKCLKNQYF